MIYRFLDAELNLRLKDGSCSKELKRFARAGPRPILNTKAVFAHCIISQEKQALFPPGARPLTSVFVRGRRLLARWPSTASSSAASFDDSHVVFSAMGRRLFGRIEALYSLNGSKFAAISVLRMEDGPFESLLERIHNEEGGSIHDSACSALELLHDNPFLRCGVIDANCSMRHVPLRQILGPAFYLYSVDAECGVAITIASRSLPV